MKIIKKIIWIGLLLFLLAATFAFGYYFAVTKNVALDPQKLILNDNNVVVYDHDGASVKGVATLPLSQTVAIEELPDHVKNAFICTEDKRFYRHNGFDFLRIGRAVLNNLKAGSFKEGASTLSQQLIKNTHLTQDKTIKRKLQEWKLTRQLEKRYTKDEILEKYLNTIYFGHRCFGIVSASDFYFQKTPSELSLAEAAILAGLVRSPNNYSPFKNPERCQKRKESVLNLMQTNGKIDEKSRLAAIHEPLPVRNSNPDNAGFLHFVFEELTDLSERFYFTVGGKIEIYTELDQALQNELETLAKSYTETDKTVMVLSNETHLFRACISSVGNVKRLPGSLIKPLLVYAPALEEDLLSPATAILDEKINYGGYAPENYGGAYHGYVSMREAVEKSLNVPAVKTLDALGVSRGAAYMEQLNLPIEKEDFSLALALGGMQSGYTLSDLTAAYSTFANGGTFQSCGFIKNIKINGKTIYQKSEEKRRVFSNETAYLMTDVLRTTAKQGTAKKLRSLPCEIAAKTGTVGTANGNTDAYALSYNKNDVVSVWLGNANNEKIQHTGGGLPCAILLELNEYLCRDYTARSLSTPTFTRPSGVKQIALDKTIYTSEHRLVLADPLSPLSFQFTEVFKEHTTPQNISTIFSCPTITPPTITIKNGVIEIVLPDNAPRFYRYKIERSNGKERIVLYDGEYKEKITDENVKMNNKYIYTITPYYEKRNGTPITLPCIFTQTDANLTEKEEEFSQKNWWEY